MVERHDVPLTGSGAVVLLYLCALELEQASARRTLWVLSARFRFLFSFHDERDACAGPSFQAVSTDGKRLVALMIAYGVGVSRRHVRVIPEVDLNFFEGD